LIINILMCGAPGTAGEEYHTSTQEQSPMANTVVVTLANGTANSGYIPNDASFGAYTFQVLSSRLQPGCAEGAIDNGLPDLIKADER
jgi:neutral ceramidase